MSLTFYFGSGSPFAWKVWLALEHKGIAYTPKRLSFDADETRKPEFLAINPRGRVPAIVDDGFALFESLAITLYLSRKTGKLWPKDVRGEGVAFQWTMWAATEVEGALGGWFYHTRFLPEAERKPEVAQESAAKLPRRFDVLEGALAQSPWLAGDSFGIADLNVAAVTYRAPAFGLERWPRIADWHRRCYARPAAQRAVALRETR
jgi:glutathione S-transferase